MEKLNPQPEPPSPISAGNILDWVVYIFQYLFWVVTIPFQLLF